ncbi:unnamed protein product [Blepharisma stoltei]|uniref:asparagine--tRNA ligase n=1 Tax=Blepharisma stoltei TaxID=1481888 RepID=A0AAU9JRH1_9CILI|nr:unnamed protein product [Blepharisma stoltei]
MDVTKISERLRTIVNYVAGQDIKLTVDPGLVGANAKYLGRVSSLLPESPLDQAFANQWIHSISSTTPFLSTKEGIAAFSETCEKLLAKTKSYAVGTSLTIVDLLVTAIGIEADLFKYPPTQQKKLAKYLNTLRADSTLKLIIPAAEAQTGQGRKQFIIPNGTGGRTRVDYILSNSDLVGQIVTVKGWARTVRIQGNGSFAFVEVNDGSTVKGIQVIVNNAFPDFSNLKGTGISVSCKGLLVESPGGEQSVEMQVQDPSQHEFKIIGDCDQTAFPISKKNHTPEFLRENAHLRTRTNLIGAIARIRNALAFATHMFFNSRGFLYVHTPLITASDCEGAGELFQVSTILKSKVADIKQKDGMVDYSQDFFGKPAFLTCSGQLNVEAYCSALSDVYTFGPTFRAENSHTTRHLSEFWMIEPEMAWAQLEDNMECAESYLKFCLQYAIDNCYADLEFFDKFVEKGLIDRLRNVLEKPFARISYTEAVDIIHKCGKQFKIMPQWGDDLNSEHERYIAEEVIKGPVIVFNYPKVLKAFYMKVNDDDATVQAMDILVPKIGEVIGGSVREDRLERLDQMIQFKNLDKESYWWYRDFRKYGSVPHAGFGLGFERLVMMVTGVENIRDVIPFPRWPGHAEF